MVQDVLGLIFRMDLWQGLGKENVQGTCKGNFWS